MNGETEQGVMDKDPMKASAFLGGERNDIRFSRRGGARQGSGRKPILTDEQRLQIGAAIHRRLWRRTRAKFAGAVDANFADDDLSTLWADLNRIPIADRHKVHVDDARLSDIEVEIEEGGLQGRRYFRGPRRVAPGIRGPIVRGVARAAFRFFGVSISPRMAERCLEEYRELDAKLSREPATHRPKIEDDDSGKV
jgi:hypothetical protein